MTWLLAWLAAWTVAPLLAGLLLVRLGVARWPLAALVMAAGLTAWSAWRVAAPDVITLSSATYTITGAWRPLLALAAIFALIGWTLWLAARRREAAAWLAPASLLAAQAGAGLLIWPTALWTAPRRYLEYPEALVRVGELSDRDVLRIGLALADALAAALARGGIHRDGKPQNVIVPDAPSSRRGGRPSPCPTDGIAPTTLLTRPSAWTSGPTAPCPPAASSSSWARRPRSWPCLSSRSWASPPCGGSSSSSSRPSPPCGRRSAPATARARSRRCSSSGPTA